jgi:hypothetical protein
LSCEAAYSKPVSALQRSISHFSRSFFGQWSQSPIGASYIAACRTHGGPHCLKAIDLEKPDKKLNMTAGNDGDAAPARKISVFGREFKMPRSRWARIAIGLALTILGLFGFLPILGFWMVPLGLLVLSYEFASVRRLRRRFVIWWGRRRTRS